MRKLHRHSEAYGPEQTEQILFLLCSLQNEQNVQRVPETWFHLWSLTIFRPWLEMQSTSLGDPVMSFNMWVSIGGFSWHERFRAYPSTIPLYLHAVDAGPLMASFHHQTWRRLAGALKIEIKAAQHACVHADLVYTHTRVHTYQILRLKIIVPKLKNFKGYTGMTSRISKRCRMSCCSFFCTIVLHHQKITV